MTCYDVSAELPVKVEYIKAKSLAFDNLKDKIALDETIVPEVLIEPSDATHQDIVYTSSDETVILVENGHLVPWEREWPLLPQPPTTLQSPSR